MLIHSFRMLLKCLLQEAFPDHPSKRAAPALPTLFLIRVPDTVVQPLSMDATSRHNQTKVSVPMELTLKSPSARSSSSVDVRVPEQQPRNTAE